MLKLSQAESGGNLSYMERDLLRFFLFAAGTGFIVMTGTIVYALSTGNFWTEGPALLEMSWGLVSLVDTYIGLVLFSCWVLWREQFQLNGFFWVILIIGLGNMISCLYILGACVQANGDMIRFWIGSKATEELAR